MSHAEIMIHAELDYQREERAELSRNELARFFAHVDTLADFADILLPIDDAEFLNIMETN